MKAMDLKVNDLFSYEGVAYLVTMSRIGDDIEVVPITGGTKRPFNGYIDVEPIVPPSSVSGVCAE